MFHSRTVCMVTYARKSITTDNAHSSYILSTLSLPFLLFGLLVSLYH